MQRRELTRQQTPSQLSAFGQSIYFRNNILYFSIHQIGMVNDSRVTVLGIDPGLADTGYAVCTVETSSTLIVSIESLGLLKTRKSQILTVRKTSDYLSRVQQQAKSIKDIVLQHKPSFVACEMTAATAYTYPTFSFGAMIGIVATLDLPIIEVLPTEVKKAVTGRSNATKAEIIAWALRKTARSRKVTWPTSQRASKMALTFRGSHVSPSAEHQADALAIIYAALGTEQFRLACAMASGRS